MKKSLMLGVAALFLSAVSASAGTYTIKLDNMADAFKITRVGQLYAQVHYFGTQVESRGVGMAATTRFAGKGFMLTDVQQNGMKFVCYNFSNPLPTVHNHEIKGGEWYAYYTYDGKHIQDLGWGTYTIVGFTGK
jgi:hypothetical protein